MVKADKYVPVALEENVFDLCISKWQTPIVRWLAKGGFLFHCQKRMILRE